MMAGVFLLNIFVWWLHDEKINDVRLHWDSTRIEKQTAPEGHGDVVLLHVWPIVCVCDAAFLRSFCRLCGSRAPLLRGSRIYTKPASVLTILISLSHTTTSLSEECLLPLTQQCNKFTYNYLKLCSACKHSRSDSSFVWFDCSPTIYGLACSFRVSSGFGSRDQKWLRLAGRTDSGLFTHWGRGKCGSNWHAFRLKDGNPPTTGGVTGRGSQRRGGGGGDESLSR